jgi:hypothetical protein
VVPAGVGAGGAGAAAAAAGSGGHIASRRRATSTRHAGHQAGGVQRRRALPPYAATFRRRWAGVEPPGAATAGRRRRLRRRRRGLHGVLPPIRHVDRRVFSYRIGRIRIYYEFGLSMLNFALYINISIFRLSLIVFRRITFEFKKIPWARRWKDGSPQAEIYIHPTLNSVGFRSGGSNDWRCS